MSESACGEREKMIRKESVGADGKKGEREREREERESLYTIDILIPS